MLLKVALKNANVRLRLLGIVLILGGIAIVLKTTHVFSRYPSWNDTVVLTVAAVILFVGTVVLSQTLLRRKEGMRRLGKHRNR